MIKNFDQLLREAERRSGVVVGVPSPEDHYSLQSVISARKAGLADFILCGKKPKISRMLKEREEDTGNYEIIAARSEEEATKKIVELAREKKIHVILKGFLSTASLMKPILDKDMGLQTGNLLSDILVLENPLGSYPGLMGITDGGLNILPDLDQKRQIIENAVAAFGRLGYEDPTVGVLAASEKVSENMPATLDARDLTRMNQDGRINGCRVFGPLALDIAVSREAALHKKVEHPVAGSARILVVPNIEVGNIFGKSFTYFLKVPVAHVVMGADIPVLIPSRNETERDKINSIALGVLCAEI